MRCPSILWDEGLHMIHLPLTLLRSLSVKSHCFFLHKSGVCLCHVCNLKITLQLFGKILFESCFDFVKCSRINP